MKIRSKSQTGRSMVEMIAVLAIMIIITLGVYAVFKQVSLRARAKTLAQEINTHVIQLRHKALTSKNWVGYKYMMQYSNMPLRLTTVDTNNKTFTLRVGKVDSSEPEFEYDLCERLMKNNSFSPNNNDKDEVSYPCQINQVFADFVFPMYANMKNFKPYAYNPRRTDKNNSQSHDEPSNNDSGEGCSINPATDCLSGALAEGECACAPAADETECTRWTTNECGKGKYCVFSPSGCGDNDHDKGVCRPVSYIGGYKSATVAGHEYTMSDCSNCPDWWSAQSWCKAFDKTMVSLSDVHCTSSGCTDTLWQDLGNALYQYSTWTTDMYGSCYAFDVGLSDGNVYNFTRNLGDAVLCVKKATGLSCPSGSGEDNTTWTGGAFTVTEGTDSITCYCAAGKVPDGHGGCEEISCFESLAGECMPCTADPILDSSSYPDAYYMVKKPEDCVCPNRKVYVFYDGVSYYCGLKECPKGHKHTNDPNVGFCFNCSTSDGLGACGCEANEVPDGNGGCKQQSWVTWTQPKLTSNGSMGRDNFACDSSSTIGSPRLAWRAFDGSNQDGEIDCWHSSNSLPVQLSWYTKDPIKINSITIQNRPFSSSDTYLVKDFKLQYLDNDSTWKDAYSGTNPKGSLASTTFNVNATTAHRYWRLYITSNHASNGNKYVSIGELTITAQVLQ